MEDAIARTELCRSIQELVRLDLFGVATPRLAPPIEGQEIAWALMMHSRAFSEREYHAFCRFVTRHFDLPDDLLESLLDRRSGSGSNRAPDHRSLDFAERLRRLACARLLGRY